jgi:hypothetical protein
MSSEPAMAGAATQLCWSNRRPEDVHDERFFTRPSRCTVHVNEEHVPIPADAPRDLRECCAHLYHGRRGYMLSDLVKQSNLDPDHSDPSNRWARWADVRRDHMHDFPDSLAADLVRQTSQQPTSYEEKLKVLHKLVAARSRRAHGQRAPHALTTSSDDGYLLVHLRVGDVIEEEEHSLAEMLDRDDVKFNLTGTRYVRGLNWYRSLDVGRMNVTRAVLLAGSHLPYASFNRSCVYVHEVRKVLQRRGLRDVELRCGQDADEDVVVAAHSRWIEASSGGFSHLLKAVAAGFGAREAPHAYQKKRADAG